MQPMNQIDFTFQFGSIVYAPSYDMITTNGKAYRRRRWKLGRIVTAYGVKTHPNDDFIYGVDLNEGKFGLFGLSELKDARTHFQPDIEILEEMTSEDNFIWKIKQ